MKNRRESGTNDQRKKRETKIKTKQIEREGGKRKGRMSERKSRIYAERKNERNAGEKETE